MLNLQPRPCSVPQRSFTRHHHRHRQRATPTRASQLALKEWAPTVGAIQSGDQIFLLRKGGIKEPTFKPPSGQSSFLLFPTHFHTDAQLLKDSYRDKYKAELDYDPRSLETLEFTCLAQVTGAWKTTDKDVLKILSQMHVDNILTDAFLEARLRWRAQQPLTLLELRAYRLETPIKVQPKEDMWGCFSWVDLDIPPVSLSSTGATVTPALSDEVWTKQQQRLRQGVEQLSDATVLTL